jgi:predicted transcriptional regulator
MKQQPAEIEEKVELTPEELAELDDRIAAVERGEFVDGDEVLRRLRSGYLESSVALAAIAAQRG